MKMSGYHKHGTWNVCDLSAEKHWNKTRETVQNQSLAMWHGSGNGGGGANRTMDKRLKIKSIFWMENECSHFFASFRCFFPFFSLPSVKSKSSTQCNGSE